MAAPIHVNAENYAAEIESFDGGVLIDFWADWCMPCKMMAPVFEAVSAARDDVKFVKINVDEAPQYAIQFGIDSIPAFVAVRGGKAVDKTVGYQDEEKLMNFVEDNL